MDSSLIDRARNVASAHRHSAGIPSIEIDEALLPIGLRHLACHAAILGVGDDPVRDAIVAGVPAVYMVGVVASVSTVRSELLQWLGEASPPYSDEWAAFASLTMAIEVFVTKYKGPLGGL